MRRTDVRTESELNQYLSQARKIKFRSDRAATNNISLRDLFITLINQEPETCYMRGGFHCSQGKYRSLYDFTLLAKHYRPETTIKDVLFLLFDYYGNSNDHTLIKRLSYCPNIRKYNFRVAWYGGNIETLGLRDIKSAIRNDYRGINSMEVSRMVDSYYQEFLQQRTNS